jgi:hypothetical protein
VEAVAAIVAEKARPKAKPVTIETPELVTVGQIAQPDVKTWQIFEDSAHDDKRSFAIIRESTAYPGYFDFLAVIVKDGASESVTFSRPCLLAARSGCFASRLRRHHQVFRR